MLRVAGHSALVLVLTLLTQLGGLAWLAALLFRRRLIAFLLAYAALGAGAIGVAPLFGRVALSCLPSAAPLQVGSAIFCLTNRTYVSPELKAVLEAAAAEMDQRHPGTVTLVLDASFPFIDGFPLIPHLSHDDGDKADLALFYRDADVHIPGALRSPVGYFAFEDGPTDCPPRRITLRWDLRFLQPLWRRLTLDEERTATLLRVLAAEPRIGKVLAEPHLSARLGLQDPKIRFQGCRAARHDDHIHVQL